MNEEQFVHFAEGQNDFKYFVNNIFSRSFKNFIGGRHVDDTADFLGAHKKTMRVSAKDHFKSTSLYAHFMWELLYRPGFEGQHFSYNASLSAYHLAKIKSLIANNEYFDEIEDLKPTSEGILKYRNVKEITTLNPNGLLGFKRGIHCQTVYVDDPFQDPDNKLNPTLIKKINRIFVTQIMDMPSRDGQQHVVGTPQTATDFFFDKDVTQRFQIKVMPAIQDELQKKVLWVEYMPFEELMHRRRERGTRIFNQEYMCKPVWTEQAWFSREKIMSAVNIELEPKKEVLTNNYVVLGWDVGKKVHPSHIAIFEEFPPGHWVQVYEKFLDGMGYNDQRLFVNELVRLFRIDKGIYDATRGEMESFVERGELSSVMQPMIFKTTNKHDMATNFEKMVENNEVELLNNRRMLDQILVVDNDLQALETPEGHGDSFWSIAMALWAVGQKTDSWDEPIY